MLLTKLALSMALLACVGSQELFRDIPFESALNAARAEKKIVMVDFFTTWCAPCKKLDATTWKDAKVLDWASKTVVALKLDAEKEAELAKRYRIGAYPTILLLKSDGSEIDRIVGYKDAAAFLGIVDDAMAGKDGVARAKVKLVGHEEDPMARMEYGRALAQAGRNDDALQEFLWCFDNPEKSPAFVGVRVSFLLSDIKRLGASHPAALEALEARRDAAEAKIDQDPADFRSASDMAALNRELGTSKRTLAAYDRLEQAARLTPSFRQAVQREIFPLLVAERRYRSALDLCADPLAQVSSRLELTRLPPNLGKDDEEMKKAMAQAMVMMQTKTVTECATIYEALLGTDRRDDAAKVAEKLIAFAPTGATYATLIRSAARAKTEDIAKALGERALASLPESEKGEVNKAIKELGPSNH